MPAVRLAGGSTGLRRPAEAGSAAKPEAVSTGGANVSLETALIASEPETGCTGGTAAGSPGVPVV